MCEVGGECYRFNFSVYMPLDLGLTMFGVNGLPLHSQVRGPSVSSSSSRFIIVIISIIASVLLGPKLS